jgi:hypothetical protein
MATGFSSAYFGAVDLIFIQRRHEFNGSVPLLGRVLAESLAGESFA